MRAFRVSVRHTVSHERVTCYYVLSDVGAWAMSAQRLVCRVNHVCEAEDGLSLLSTSVRTRFGELAVPCDGEPASTPFRF